MTPDELLHDPTCLVVCNHSGGKDSQAMYLLLRELVPDPARLVVIHAHLPEVEWPGTFEHIEATVDHELHEVRARKTFFEMVEHRGRFPSPANRQCTSDLKRGPIQKQIRRLCSQGGYTKVLNCMGLRAEESSARAKKQIFRLNASQSCHKRVERTWYEWLPIHELTTSTVFAMIRSAGQQPHWAYAEGMSRLSCCFCIMSSAADICTASRLRPELFERYVATEKRLGFSLLMPGKDGAPRYLDRVVEDHENEEQAAAQLELFAV